MTTQNKTKTERENMFIILTDAKNTEIMLESINELVAHIVAAAGEVRDSFDIFQDIRPSLRRKPKKPKSKSRLTKITSNSLEVNKVK